MFLSIDRFAAIFNDLMSMISGFSTTTASQLRVDWSLVWRSPGTSSVAADNCALHSQVILLFYTLIINDKSIKYILAVNNS